jgi:hypothetical protein
MTSQNAWCVSITSTKSEEKSAGAVLSHFSRPALVVWYLERRTLELPAGENPGGVFADLKIEGAKLQYQKVLPVYVAVARVVRS